MILIGINYTPANTLFELWDLKSESTNSDAVGATDFTENEPIRLGMSWADYGYSYARLGTLDSPNAVSFPLPTDVRRRNVFLLEDREALIRKLLIPCLERGWPDTSMKVRPSMLKFRRRFEAVPTQCVVRARLIR